MADKPDPTGSPLRGLFASCRGWLDRKECEMSNQANWTRPLSVAADPQTLAQLDRLAREQDRSRSWIVRDLIRQAVTRGEVQPPGKEADQHQP